LGQKDDRRKDQSRGAAPGDSLIEIALAQFEDNPIRATFLRNYALEHLPGDTGICLRVSELLLRQKYPELADKVAEKVLASDAESLPAQRVIARCKLASKKPADAVAIYQRILKNPRSGADDYVAAGYLVSKTKDKSRCEQIFDDGIKRFPDDIALKRKYGWALVNIGQNEKATTVFEAIEQSLPPDETVDTDLLAGEVVSRWAANAKDGAMETARRLIATDPRWADPEWVKQKGWPAEQETPLLNVVAELLRQQPDLKPKQPENSE